MVPGSGAVHSDTPSGSIGNIHFVSIVHRDAGGADEPATLRLLRRRIVGRGRRRHLGDRRRPVLDIPRDVEDENAFVHPVRNE